MRSMVFCAKYEILNLPVSTTPVKPATQSISSFFTGLFKKFTGLLLLPLILPLKIFESREQKQVSSQRLVGLVSDAKSHR